MKSLRLLGTVGEPINPGSLDVVSRAHRARPLPHRGYLVANRNRHDHDRAAAGRHAHQAGIGHAPDSRRGRRRGHARGRSGAAGGGGYLVFKRPWPAMLRTIYGDPKRYQEQYWSQIPGMYFTGDGARKDEDGYFWIMGRIDDVINVSGHRLSTMEVESALVAHPKVAEAAVVPGPTTSRGRRLWHS